jgi:CRP-like cAMP-binding protein
MNFDLILENISRHIELTSEESAYFTSLLVARKIRKKDFLLREGEINTHETFVNKGCLRNYTVDEKGNEHIIMFAIEDWWTSDLYSFLAQAPATFTIDALEDTEVWQISKDNLEKLFEKVPKFERFFRIMFQKAFIAQQDRINQNLSLTAEERYNRFVSKYPRLEQRIAQKQLASYLGITPEFLSMLRKKRAGR